MSLRLALDITAENRHQLLGGLTHLRECIEQGYRWVQGSGGGFHAGYEIQGPDEELTREGFPRRGTPAP